MSGADKRAGGSASATLILMRVVFWGTAVIVLGVAAIATQRTRSWLAEAERAPGVVVDLDVSRGTRNDVTYAPVVAFALPDGRTVEFTSGTRSYPAPYARGAAVTVLYRPAAPEDAAIDAFWSLWLGPVICGSIGLVFLAFSRLLL